MDSSIKSVISIVILFVMTLLLTSIITFSISINKATTLLYSVIQDIEIYGYDEEKIKQISSSNQLTILVEPAILQKGFQYEVKISVEHVFAFINKQKRIEICGLTRVIE